MKKMIYVVMLFFFFSCKGSVEKKITDIVSYWQNREVIFPKDTSFVSYSRKFGERKVHLQKGEYTILNYADSTGCMSCKLQLPDWSEFINFVDSLSNGTVPFVFVFQSNAKNDMIHFLEKVGFDYPVYIDENNNFDKLNKFPTEMELQTFLLDSNNRVVAMGNPVHNHKVKELYLDIIQGRKIEREKEKTIRTEVNVDKSYINMGSFGWQEEQKVVFALTNTGSRPLIIENINTSCGCTSVEYSKEPVRPGDSVNLNVTYKADHPEYFDKTITVYCNSESSPIILRITGNAE